MPGPYRIFHAGFAALCLVLLSCPSSASSSMRTLTRTEDFVVLVGADVPGLTGAEVSCLHIAFQVDKVDTAGRYVFPEDKYHDPDRDGTLLDANDELCFMAGDAGDKRPFSWKPESATQGVEIELRDPLDGGMAWVYLFNEPGTDPPDVPDYVDYWITGGETFIQSSRFTLGYQTGRVNYDLMQLRNTSGELGPDILDRQRVGLMARMAKHNMSLNVPESIIRTVDIALIDGPVRVIIDQIIVINLADISFQFGSEYFMIYYRCGQNNSVFFKFPLGLNKILKSLVFYWSLDFTPAILGSIYIDPHHPKTISIKPRIVEAVPNDATHYWWGLSGKNGTLLQALDLDDDVLPYFTCDGLWHQDSDAKDKRGDHPGRIEIGFTCHEIESMPEKKDYHWFNYILFPAEPSLAGVKALQNIVEHPLQITTENLP
jgi:hypothetical protein